MMEGEEVVCRDGRVGYVMFSPHPAMVRGAFIMLRSWWGHVFLVRPEDILDEEGG